MRKHEQARSYARALVAPFMIGVWMMGWAAYWIGESASTKLQEKKPGRLKVWLETVARGKW